MGHLASATVAAMLLAAAGLAAAAPATRLFDGHSLAGWQGDTRGTWRVEDGAIVGGSLERAVPRNEFLCTGRAYGDFVLRLKFRLRGEGAPNAGVQVRSRRLPEPANEMEGYQADLGDGHWGALYDESRRNRVLAAPDPEVVRRALRPGEWNDYEVRCEGRRIQIRLNGARTVDYTEPDPSVEQVGLIGLQVHGGGRTEVRYRDLVLEELAVAEPVETPGPAGPGLWEDLAPALPGAAVRRANERFPLSDQRNRARWTPYRPMWDEFGGHGLDASKWLARNPGWKGRQPAFFSPRNVEVREGELRLTMRLEEAPPELRGEGYHTFSSAAVQSLGTVRYGYFEVRAKPMASAGSSSFWFYKGDPDRWTEIDVFEIGGRAAGFERRLHMTLHVFHTPTHKTHWSVGGVLAAPFDLADGFHVYGLEWDPAEVRFYLDGALVRRGPNTHWHQALTLNLDSETMPDWFGLPLPTDLPSVYRVDYVRAWQRAPWRQ